jgi:hypothetical protein
MKLYFKIPFNWYFIFIVLFLASCKEKTRPLELSDLMLDKSLLFDYSSGIYNEREALAVNRIDTMFLIYDQSVPETYLSWRMGRLTDTAGYYVYDDNGRILETQLFCNSK